MADTKNDKNSNSPALRFPGFTEPWQRIKVDDLLEFFSTNSLSWEQLSKNAESELMNLHYGLIHVGLPTIVNIKQDSLPYVKGDAIPRNYELCENGDVSFADASEDTSEVAKVIEFTGIGNEKVISGLHTIHGRDKLGLTVIGFKGYLFSSQSFNNQTRRIAQGSKVFSISAKNFSEILVSVPSKEEQRKIAELLRLIDERIATQRRLIEKLETLIKGVREHCLKNISGEEVYLSSIAEIYQPQTISSLELVDNGFPVYGANGIIGYYNSYNHETEQICITCRGNTCGTVNYSLAKSWITGNAMVVNTDSHSDIVCKRFLFHFLSEYNFKSIISGSGQPQIVRSPLQKIKLVLPSLDKQMQVANFFDTILYKTNLKYFELNLLQKQRQYLLQHLFI